MVQEPRVSAVILAAGMSTRMGALKQLLPLNGRTLLENVLESVRKSQVDEVVLVLGFEADTIQEKIPLDRVKVVVNEAYREGMGASVRVGIEQVSPDADAALVMLADQPFVKPDSLDRLIHIYAEQKPQIVIPVYQGFRGNPVLLDRSVFPELLNLGGDIGCRAIFGSHTENILKVPVEDIGVLVDIDTQADFEKFSRGDLATLESADLTGRDVPAGPHLMLVGQEEVTYTLASLGRLMNFTVTVVDPFLTIEQIPAAHRVLHTLDLSGRPSMTDTYVVIASRGRFDEEAIEQSLDGGAVYVALVANRKRADEIRRGLEGRAMDAAKIARMHAPAGLAIGAAGPEEIALSIMAEIIAERRPSHRTP